MMRGHGRASYWSFGVPTWARRLLAVTALIVVLLGLAGVVGLPLQRWYQANDDQLEESRRLIARLRAIAAPPPTTAPQTESWQAYAPDFLSGAEDTLITADLQTKLRTLVVGHNAELSSVRVLPPKSLNGLTYLGLNLQLRGELKDLQQILHAIDMQTPVLIIDRAHLRIEESQVQMVTTIAAGTRLFADIDVSGARWPGPPLPAQPAAPR